MASGYSEENYDPRHDEELSNVVAQVDLEEASRAFHPDPACCKMTDVNDSDDEDMDFGMEDDIIRNQQNVNPASH